MFRFNLNKSRSIDHKTITRSKHNLDFILSQFIAQDTKNTNFQTASNYWWPVLPKIQEHKTSQTKHKWFSDGLRDGISDLEMILSQY